VGPERVTFDLRGADGPRRPRNAEETQRRILAAAESEFASKGFDGARLGSIARAAQVQQALIHHYFVDKAGLHREVVRRALAAFSAEGWDILKRLARPARLEIRPLVEAFTEMMVRFYTTHGALLAIVQHDAAGEGKVAASVIADSVKPVFDALVAIAEDLRARGEIRADVDARHLCISGLAMASFAVQEERLLRALWPVEERSPAFLDERRREISETILSRIGLPAATVSRSRSAPRTPRHPRRHSPPPGRRRRS